MTARPNNPDLQDLFDAYAARIMHLIRGPMPGRVERYDAATQTADVLPLVRFPVMQPDGDVVYEDSPVVPMVSVLFPRAGAWAISHRLDPGDTVLLVPLEASPGAWVTGDGSMQNPEDLRRHHLGSCVAIPGLFAHSRALTNAPGFRPAPSTDDNNGVTLGHDTGTRVTLRTNGSLRVTQGATVVIEVDPSGNVTLGATGAGTSLVALAALVDARLASLRSDFNGHTHNVTSLPVAGGGGGSVSGITAGPSPLLTAFDSVAATKVRAT